jgi:PKD repeat protein
MVEIYGDRTPITGEASNYRVRLHPGAFWPVNYLWDMGEGTVLIGNNVLQRYDSPGRYTITVVASNRLSADTLTTQVEVRSRDGGLVRDADVVTTDPPETDSATRPAVRYRPEELRGTTPVVSSDGGYGWVVGSYLDRSSAEQLMRQFRVKGFRAGVIVDSRAGASTAYRVVVGQFASTVRALSAKREVQRLIATPITIIDIANPSIAVGARQGVVRQPADPPRVRTVADPGEANTAEEAERQPSINVRSSLPVEDIDEEPVVSPPAQVGPPAQLEPPAQAEPPTPEPEPLTSGAPGPQIRSLKVYVRDGRLLLFLDGVSDRNHGIRRVEYRVFSGSGDQLSNWSEVSLVPPGRSSYGLQMHRVPVPEGLDTEGGRVEVRAVNSEGGFTILSTTIGSE